MCCVEELFSAWRGYIVIRFGSVLHSTIGRFCISACMQQQPAVGDIFSFLLIYRFFSVCPCMICSSVSFPPHLLIFVSRVLTVEFARF